MSRTFHVLAKPVGAKCNLDCSYCFYLDKQQLYPDAKTFRMTDDVLEAFIRQYIEAQDTPEVAFAWQGGEPTLLGMEFFRRVVSLQRKYANGKRISNSLQTNATLLDANWCRFLAEHGFLVGVSLDGPAAVHDAFRVDKQGKPTFRQVMRGIDLLKQHRVDFNTLTVVNRRNAESPLALYRFLKETGSGFMQFIPLVEISTDALPPGCVTDTAGTDGSVSAASVGAEQYGEFLVAIFDEWVRRDVGRVFVQLFDVALGRWAGYPSALCLFEQECGAALAVEHNGDVYSCDHYVYPQYRLGNLLAEPLGVLATKPLQREFGSYKSAALPQVCRSCEVLFVCQGECPKNRVLRADDGEPGLNYLCAGYKRFFRHIDGPMRVMAELLGQRRSPAEIMSMLPRQDRSK